MSLPCKDLPLWHSTIFFNKHHNTYFAPQLIRQGVLTVVHLFDSNFDLQPRMHKFISRWWLPSRHQGSIRHCL